MNYVQSIRTFVYKKKKRFYFAHSPPLDPTAIITV